MNENKKTSLILHGHFYQPPRENPRTGIIPQQSSAAPWKNWNERIFHDCYGANMHSRYLSPEGRVISITNNFSYISYNFGPTLLYWLEHKRPEELELLIESDMDSEKRLGHGNAMAQGFNHTILPLDRREDAKLQVNWGIEAFQHYFRRDPEGMWLPETAISSDVISILAESGIKFVVLSPWQCKSIIDESGELLSLDGKPAPYDRPFILEGTHGERISCFFYNHKLAEDISFKHILRSADDLYNELLSIRENDGMDLIHTATDGEIYGHHEPYGDMALAALIRKVNERDDFEFTNYAAYLEEHPATEHALLHSGEDGKGTSWSCAHGVSRWYNNCGCQTGGEPGWSQEWRVAFRASLENLRDRLYQIFSSETNRIFGGKISSYDLLNRSGRMISGKCTMQEFIADLHGDFDFPPTEDREIAHLIIGMKNTQFSFTSCGFFFADISGIEPRQNIQYALYAIKMFQDYCNTDLLLPFLSDLIAAKSNRKNVGDGMMIAQEELKGLSGSAEACLAFYLNRNFAREQEFIDEYGWFTLESYKGDTKNDKVLTILNTENLDHFEFTVLSSSTMDNGINLYVSTLNLDTGKRKHLRMTNNDISPRLLSKCLKWIDSSMNQITYNEIEDMTNSMFHYSLLVETSKYLTIDTIAVENLGVAIKIIKSHLAASLKNASDAVKNSRIDMLIEFIKKNGRDKELKTLEDLLSSYSNRIGRKVRDEGLTEMNIQLIFDIIGLARRHGYEPSTTKLQNEIYPYYEGTKRYEVSEELARKVFDALNFK